ncbi:tetratricopeptide repeat protein [Roseobacter sp. HKCCA0434]|uniref:tetratricopeptide repeat protein n=1 Tax=Roseobacter sp. HKCCA0434 TaxID=3079297 RepID=UPI00290591E0|nr:tetratricopeptide repeat protein [Roseobacter sp. HKCCA0434]
MLRRFLIVLTALALPLAAPALAQSRNLSGAYLAAQQAEMRSDHRAAALYYTRALGFDGENTGLLQRAMQAQVAAGDVDVAASIADRLLDLNTENQFATLVALADDVAEGDFASALARIEEGEQGVTPLLADLLRGWLMIALGDVEDGRAVFARIDGNDTYRVFAAYHRALALALEGDIQAASAAMETGADGPIRLNRRATLARIQLLAEVGQTDTALTLTRDVLATGFGDSAFGTLRRTLENEGDVSFDLISSPTEGIAEVFFDLASVLGDEGEDVALIYGRLSTHIQPELSDAQLLVAEILNRQGQFALSGDAFDAVPSDAPQFVEAELGRADALDKDDREGEALAVLSGLVQAYPNTMRLNYLYGEALRRAERPDEAVEALDRAVSLLGEPMQRHWLVFYQRGVSHHDAGRWPQAEADFRQALDLDPDNALVLNYLGYSMVEERQNLDEALEMIRNAVAQRPYDGYITDSLGWVLYRLGRFEEAVEPMERAVELAPVDPIINDHLGDVYWTVGRKREAEFQWRRALSFDPEPAEEARIRQKLDIGLDAVIAQEEAGDG